MIICDPYHLIEMDADLIEVDIGICNTLYKTY